MILPDDAQEMKGVAHEFAREVLRPAAEAIDRSSGALADSEEFWSTLETAYEIGFHRLPFPPESGGLGQDPVTIGVVLEELAWGDAGFASTLMANFSLMSIAVLGDAKLRLAYVEPYLSDRTGRYLGASAGTEPDAGSDLFNWTLEDDPRIGVQTLAKVEGGEYVLRGTKRFTTNGGLAKVYTVVAKTDKKRGMESAGLFVVPGDASGLSFGTPEDKLGQRCSVQSDLVLDGVRVPKSHRLGLPGSWMEALGAGLGHQHAHMAALATGIARAAYECALAYSKERWQGGCAIGEHQAVALRLSDMAIRIEAARAMYLRACFSYASGGGADGHLGTFAKIFATDAAVEVTNAAMLILGGYGYMRSNPVEKYLRDAKLCQIYDGANDVLRVMMASRITE